MPNLNWHEYLLLVSFFASVAGLLLLFIGNPTQELDELEGTDQSLLSMSFGYWIVHCISVGILKLNLIESDDILMSLRLTAIVCYFLTFACILCLPLHRMSVRQVE